MLRDPSSADSPPPRKLLQPGQTLIFTGDHTSPDDPGYVGVVRGVLDRFHPVLNLRLISAGSKGQKAGALRSRTLMEILTSSRPDWLVVGIGLADALAEPVAPALLELDRQHARERAEGLEETFGPEHQPGVSYEEPVPDSGPKPTLRLEGIGRFEEDLEAAVAELRAAGVRVALLTLVTPGSDRDFSINELLNSYSKAIRRVAEAQDVVLVDVDRAFRNLFDRATNYKQRVSLSGPDGKLNPQGQTLIARNFLESFGLLPQPGSRQGRG